MTCAAVAASALLWLAAAPASAELSAPPAILAQEPLFAEIVDRARSLKTQAEGLRASAEAPGDSFIRDVRRLAELDMQGQKIVRDRGNDGDLACILRGISEDLAVKLDALAGATEPSARENVLRELIYLLNDNVEVIVTPPSVQSGVPADGAI